MKFFIKDYVSKCDQMRGFLNFFVLRKFLKKISELARKSVDSILPNTSKIYESLSQQAPMGIFSNPVI